MIRGFVAGLVLFVCGLLCLDPPAKAWWQSIQQVAISGAAGYVGPVDIYTDATICYSVRACSAASRGQPAMNVCNTTGGVEVACVDYSTDATTGDLVITTIGGLTCSSLGLACSIRRWYNQVGGTPCATSNNCDLGVVLVTTLSQRPSLNTNCTNGKACLVCTVAAQSQLTSATNINTVAQAFTTSDVSNRTSGTASGDLFNSGGVEIYYSTPGNLKGMYAGTAQTQTATDNNWNSTQSMFNGASSTMYLNGSSNAKSAGAGSMTGAIIRLCGSASINANVVEFFVSPTNQTSNFSTIYNNQKTYYGTL